MSGGSQKTSTSQTTSNPYAISQYQSAQSSLPSSFSTLTGGQIQSYMSPFAQSVINANTAYANQQQQQALNANGDQAIAQGAFGGNRNAVADSLTRGQFDLNNQVMAAGLNNQNYTQALGVAQQQNAAQNQYPLLVQQLLGQMAQGTQQNSSGTQNTSALGFNLNDTANSLGTTAGSSILAAMGL